MNLIESIADKFNNVKNLGPAAELAVDVAADANFRTGGYTAVEERNNEINQNQPVQPVTDSRKLTEQVMQARENEYRDTINDFEEEDMPYFREKEIKIQNSDKKGEQTAQSVQTTQQAKEEDIER